MGLRCEWPFPSLPRVTEVGLASVRSECQSDASVYTIHDTDARGEVATTILANTPSLENLYDLFGRAGGMYIDCVLENLANFESIFPRRKFDWPPPPPCPLANFLIFNITCRVKTRDRIKILMEPGPLRVNRRIKVSCAFVSLDLIEPSAFFKRLYDVITEINVMKRFRLLPIDASAILQPDSAV